MSITKNVLLNWYSSIKKKLRKIRMIFDSQILALFDNSPLIQNSKFNNFLWVCWFLILYSLFENSTTRTAIVSISLDLPTLNFKNCSKIENCFLVELENDIFWFMFFSKYFFCFIPSKISLESQKRLHCNYYAHNSKINVFSCFRECFNELLKLVSEFYPTQAQSNNGKGVLPEERLLIFLWYITSGING